jgi:hypothetical protein
MDHWLDELTMAHDLSWDAFALDHAAHPNNQAVLNILHSLWGRAQPQPLAQDTGIYVGPSQLTHPDNRQPAARTSDGAYVSNDGRFGINLEVERYARDRRRGRPSAPQEELRKQHQAMGRALLRPAAGNVVTGGAGAGRIIRPDDVQRTATVLVETDPANPNLIRRIRHQTFRVQEGRVLQNTRTVFHGPPISVRAARARGLLDRIRRPTPVRTATAAQPRVRARLRNARISPRLTRFL